MKAVWMWMGVLACLLCSAALAERADGGLLESVAQPQEYKAKRASSYDPSGGNADGRQDQPIKPGETREMANIEGPGAITHIWVTIASRDPMHLKNLVLRMYWDGEDTPSVESPIGDFFGLGWGQYYHYASLPIQIGTNNGLNCFWHMPYSKGARVTVTNEGNELVRAFYYYVDYREYERDPRNPMRFHAHYRQAFPCVEGENYTVLETTGRGTYLGCNLSIHNRADGWWGEGDDMIYVDGESFPSLHGTGSEDYFCGAWCYGEAFSNPYFGAPLRGEHKTDEYWNVYRYHLEDPVPFEKSILVTLEHGHANDRSDNWTSVAYWYQTHPRPTLPPMPPASERMPGGVDVALYKEAGAIEFERLAAEIQGPGVVEQEMWGFGKYSEARQLWLQAGVPSEYTWTIDAGAEDAGSFDATLWYTVAPDYGQVRIALNGEDIAEYDGYHEGSVERQSLTFPVTVVPGQNTVTIKITGKHPASAGLMAGLDCLVLTPRKAP